MAQSGTATDSESVSVHDLRVRNLGFESKSEVPSSNLFADAKSLTKNPVCSANCELLRSSSAQSSVYEGCGTIKWENLNNNNATGTFNNVIGFSGNGSLRWRLTNDYISTGAQNFAIVDEVVGVTSPRLLIDSSGNLGIGTTSPLQKLHVEGQCVAEDSLITLADGTKKKIKDIKEGDLVQSLDEATRKIVSNKVNALLDMGNKTIFEITTEPYRAINTTGNHPYLVKLDSKEECDKYKDTVWNRV